MLPEAPSQATDPLLPKVVVVLGTLATRTISESPDLAYWRFVY